MAQHLQLSGDEDQAGTFNAQLPHFDQIFTKLLNELNTAIEEQERNSGKRKADEFGGIEDLMSKMDGKDVLTPALAKCKARFQACCYR